MLQACSLSYFKPDFHMCLFCRTENDRCKDIQIATTNSDNNFSSYLIKVHIEEYSVDVTDHNDICVSHYVGLPLFVG